MLVELGQRRLEGRQVGIVRLEPLRASDRHQDVAEVLRGRRDKHMVSSAGPHEPLVSEKREQVVDPASIQMAIVDGYLLEVTFPREVDLIRIKADGSEVLGVELSIGSPFVIRLFDSKVSRLEFG